MTGHQKFVLLMFAIGCMLAMCLGVMYAPTGH
jgi:hypothetical protein